jgi:hypothetical protein
MDTTRTQVDFLFAFQTLMLAEVAKAPMHWSQDTIKRSTAKALEASKLIENGMSEVDIVEAAGMVMP